MIGWLRRLFGWPQRAAQEGQVWESFSVSPREDIELRKIRALPGVLRASVFRWRCNDGVTIVRVDAEIEWSRNLHRVVSWSEAAAADEFIEQALKFAIYKVQCAIVTQSPHIKRREVTP